MFVMRCCEQKEQTILSMFFNRRVLQHNVKKPCKLHLKLNSVLSEIFFLGTKVRKWAGVPSEMVFIVFSGQKIMQIS